jgi:hypothetical protein
MKKRVGEKVQRQMEKEARRKRSEKRAVLSLLENKSLLGLFKAVEQKWARQWRLADTLVKREDLWHKLRGLDAVYVEMKARIDRGTAQENLDREHNIRSRAGAAI